MLQVVSDVRPQPSVTMIQIVSDVFLRYFLEIGTQISPWFWLLIWWFLCFRSYYPSVGSPSTCGSLFKSRGHTYPTVDGPPG